jgi:hypothetical protein
MAAHDAVQDASVMPRSPSRFRALVRRVAGPRYPLPSSRLIRCQRCRLDLANPVAWREDDGSHWWIRLRCGGCGSVREVVVPDEDAQRLDRDLDRGLERIATALFRLDRATMRAEADTLTAALERDLIGPEDFRH